MQRQLNLSSLREIKQGSVTWEIAIALTVLAEPKLGSIFQKARQVVQGTWKMAGSHGFERIFKLEFVYINMIMRQTESSTGRYVHILCQWVINWAVLG